MDIFVLHTYKKISFIQWIGFVSLLITLFCGVYPAGAEDAAVMYTLESSIQQALQESTAIHAAMEGVLAAKERKEGQFTEFLPKFSAGYSYTRRDGERRVGSLVLSPQNIYEFSATVDQPIFKGFHLMTKYRVAGLELDISQFELEQTRQEIILQTKETYFGVLQAERLLRVAEDAVIRLSAHEKVARSFYEVGMTPKNDLLEAEVALANAKQELVVAENRLRVAYAQFNILLRRPIDTPVILEDLLTYKHVTQTWESAWEASKQNRTELKMADLQVAIAERNVQLARKDYTPDINLRGNYSKLGDNPNVQGGEGIIDPDSWHVMLSATWTFWEWGKTRHGVREKLSLLAQAKEKKEQAEDDIRLEVKKAYLKLRESEKNIFTVKKAIEQAQENLRMNEERYKAQVATSTDVLDARTLLSKTETNYYNALSDYNIAKAQLDRAMGIAGVRQ
jgi:outer membrane protein TolC